jgi:hypothetical protein
MPFKGDMRLGGPHDNEARLNGTHDGPSVPSAGTILRTENNVPWGADNGGPVITFEPEPENPPTYFTASSVTVDVKADGLGGEYYDWNNVRNQEYYPDGDVLISNYSNGYLQLEINGTYYENGTYVNDVVADGYGSWRYQSTYTYYENSGNPFHTDGSQTRHETYYGQEYVVGTQDILYYHDGNGGYTTEIGNIQTYEDYTILGGRNESLYMEVPEGSGNSFQYGTQAFEVYIISGLPTDSGAAYSTEYEANGTYITSVDGTQYYWDGNGSYYETQNEPYGTPTGNEDSGTNYIEIEYSQYENGSWSAIEYWDGSGSTYWEYSYFYAEYGYLFTYQSVDDGMGNYYTVYYYSDGNGSYYTE